MVWGASVKENTPASAVLILPQVAEPATLFLSTVRVILFQSALSCFDNGRQSEIIKEKMNKSKQ
jgi:hypothetical protein